MKEKAVAYFNKVVQNLSTWAKKKPRKTSVKTARIRAKIRTSDLQVLLSRVTSFLR